MSTVRLCATVGVLYLALTAICACPGCGQAVRPVPTTGMVETHAPRAAPTVTGDDLKAAEDIVRAFWEAVLQHDYLAAASCTEAVTVSEAQCRVFERQYRSGLEPKGLTDILSVGPSRQDVTSPHNILVPYSVAGKEEVSGEAIVRKASPTHGWLISGGI
jgi:hypothetical protein